MVGGVTCAKFQIEIFMGYDFTGGRPVEFSIFVLILAWPLQQCSATALPVMQWLNYSKLGGGIVHFLPSLSLPSLPFPFPSFPSFPFLPSGGNNFNDFPENRLTKKYSVDHKDEAILQ